MRAIFCYEFVSALYREDRFEQDWISTLYVGEWSFPITCVGRIRARAAPGRTKCKRRVVRIACGIKQLARHLLGAKNPEVARLLSVCHGADKFRASHSVRQSVETTARRLIRGLP